MSKALIVINAYYKDQISVQSLYLNEAQKFGIDIATVSRSKIPGLYENYALFPLNTFASSPTTFVDSKSLHLAAEIILEEIRYDRDFITKGDFYIFGKNKLPHNINNISLEIAAQILNVIKLSSPDVIIPGHADNWLGSSIFRIAEHLSIPAGFALEIFYKSKKAVVIDSFTYNNTAQKIGDMKLFSAGFPTNDELNHKGILSNHERHTFEGARIEKLAWQKSLIALIKSELKNFSELRWRRKNQLERWMLVDQVLPGVNLCRAALRKAKEIYIRVKFREIEVSGIKQQGKPVCIVMLHMAPEAANLAFCKEYVNQLYFVEKLKKYFGDYVDLFVKEHPYQQLGLRKISFYKNLEALTKGFIFRETGFTDLIKLRHKVYFATLHGSVTFHCSENKVICIVGNEESFHKNLPYVFSLEELPDISDFLTWDNLMDNDDSFSTLTLLSFLEDQGQVVEYLDDVSGQMELARRLMK